MKDSAQSAAPKIQLNGVWRRVSTLDDPVTYADLVGMPWECQRADADDPGDFKLWTQFGEKHSADCAHGTRHMHMELLAGPASPMPGGAGQLPSGEERLSALRAWEQVHDKGWKKCDPTGHASVALSWTSFNHWRINVFSVSANPLYPPPDFYNQWSNSESDVKAAFQIYWLITQQKAKSGAR